MDLRNEPVEAAGDCLVVLCYGMLVVEDCFRAYTDADGLF